MIAEPAASFRPLDRFAQTTAAAAFFLLIAGGVLAANTLFSASGGAQTITVGLNDKRIITSSCGENGEDTCTHYVLEGGAGSNLYDLDVAQTAYEKAEIGICYEVTYYPRKGLFSTAADTTSYQRIDTITRIEVADPTACQ